MRKRVYIVLAVLLVILAGAISWQVLREREPVYQGKRLSVWLVQYGTNHFPTLRDGELGPQAETAIRHIGTNAIPIFLSIITTRESPFKLRVMALVPNRWLARLRVRSMFDYRFLGAFGLIALGVDAKSAIPTLIGLLNDTTPDVRFIAGFTLESLGPEAGDDLLPQLEKCLEGPDAIVQSQAIRVLAQIRQRAEVVIPILVEILAKPQNQQHSAILRRDAIRALRQFGPQARPAVPKLVELLRDTNTLIRSAATNALKQIDPEAAAKAGVK